MPGIEDLTNIMMAGGRPDVPMGPPPGPPGPPMGGPPPPLGPPMGGPPPDMMANQGPPPPGPPMGGPPPDMMADQIPTEGAAPNIEEDSAALAEAVVGRAGGDIQMAVVILDTAKDLLMQSAEQPQMMKYGGDIGGFRPQFDPNLGQPSRVPPRPTSRQMQQQAFLTGGGGRGMQAGGAIGGLAAPLNVDTPTPNMGFQAPPRVNPSMLGAGMARRANQAGRLGSRGPGGWNMGGPLYAAQGRALSDSDIDETDILKQMIMDEMMQSQSQEGRTLSDKDEKMFKDYQPEGLLKGTIFDYVPDPYQISNWLSDKFGYPGIDAKGAGRAESDRDRTISDRISEEEVRNEIRMLEREEPSSQRDMTYDEALEYLQQLRQPSR